MIPIGTDIDVRRTPWANYALVATNVAVYLLLNVFGRNQPIAHLLTDRMVLDAGEPRLYQFFTYQFLHAGFAHIAGNMIFLWVFGNAVNARMGHVPYLLFYLATGVIAAAGSALGTDARMLGASGAIAGVTTAFLVFFPRSRINFLFIFIIITTWELPALWIIVLKIILWDNILAPRLAQDAGNVAYEAHLAGYTFGFLAALFLLWIRAVPRSQFDILSLWRRWWQRQVFRDAMADPVAQARAQYGQVANPDAARGAPPAPADPKQERIAELRQQIGPAMSHRDMDAVKRIYDELLELDPQQYLSREVQLELSNYLLSQNRYEEAAAAYESLLSHFPRLPDAEQIRLLLGVIYARYLQQYDMAERHLRACQQQLVDERQRSQCAEWLDVIAQAKASPGPG
jgi:membrane associated rhomboid family serine protease